MVVAAEPKEPQDLKELAASLAEQLKQRDAGISGASERIESIEKRLNPLIDQINEIAKAKASAGSLPGVNEGKQKYSISKFMLGVASRDFSVCQFEKACSDEILKQETVQRAMATVPDSGGGFAVPTEELNSQFIPLLYASLGAQQLGATMLDLSGIPTLIPRVSGGTTAYWASEAATITASDLNLQQLSMSPRTLAAITVVSELLLRTATPSIDGMLTQDQARQLALKLDAAVLEGAGASGQPLGIINTSGVGSLISTTSPVTYALMTSTVQNVRASNALDGRLGWFMHNTRMTELWQMVDTATLQLDRRVLSEGPLKAVLGYPFVASANSGLTATTIVFGNWAELLIGRWGPLMMASTNAVNFTSLQSHIRTHMFVDLGIRHPASFCK